MMRFPKLLILMGLALAVLSCGKESGVNGGDDDNTQKPLTDPSIPMMSDACIQYELKPEAVMVPAKVARQVDEVDTESCLFVLPASAQKPEVGQILIFNTPTEALPDGLLAKVTDVQEAGSGYVVSYQNAEVTEAFKSLKIDEAYLPIVSNVERVVDPDGNDVKGAEWGPSTKGKAKGVEVLELKLPERGIKVDGVEITPKMSIDMVMRYMMDNDGLSVKYANLSVDADVTLAADLELATLAEAKLFEKSIPLATIFFKAIVVGPVVLTPYVDLALNVRAEGKVSLEASVSYKRTVHTRLSYQSGASGLGLTPTVELEPEAPDALEIAFGPKFEGGFVFGMGIGVGLGLYGQSLALGSALDLGTKMTISSKLDLAAFKGTTMDWLSVYDLNDPLYPDLSKHFEYASKWKFAAFEDIMYNEALVVEMEANLVLGFRRVGSVRLPEYSVPIDSYNVCPQVKVDEKDFFTSTASSLVTLKLHHPKKSLFDEAVEYRAVFTPAGDGEKGKPSEVKFNFDDEIRSRLKAQIKNDDVYTTATAQLSDDSRYDLVVYMDIDLLDLSVPVFEGKSAPMPPVKIEPDELAYTAEGGTQSAQIDAGLYKYYGARVREEGEGWCEARCPGNFAVDISVDPNEGKEARTCVVDCWVSERANPAEEDKVYVSVQVSQEASSNTGSGILKITEITYLRFNCETDAETHLVWTEPKEDGGGGSMTFNEMYYMWHKTWDEITFSQSGSTLTIQAMQVYSGPNGDMMFNNYFGVEVVVTGFEEPYSNCRVQTASFLNTAEGKTTLDEPFWLTTSAKDQVTLSNIPMNDHRVYQSGKTGDFIFVSEGRGNVQISGYSAVNHSTRVGGYYQDRNHYYVGSDRDLGVVEFEFNYQD